MTVRICAPLMAVIVGVCLTASGTAQANDGAAHALAEKFAGGAEKEEAAKRKAEEEKRKAAEAKRRAAEEAEMLARARTEAAERKAAADKARAEEEAAEARRVAEEQAAEAKRAENARRLAERQRIAREQFIAEQLRAEEERRLAEERRAAEEKRAEEDRRIAEEKRRADEERLAAERRAEDERVAAEKRAEEERRIAEEKRRADEERIALEKRAEEERRLAEERRAAEEKRIAEEKRAEEERRIAEEQRAEEEKLKAMAAEREEEHRRLTERLMKLDEKRSAQTPVAPNGPMALGGPAAATAKPLTTRVTVLLVMESGTNGIRRYGKKTADPVLCTGATCWISAGTDRSAMAVTRGQALGPANTLGRRAAACNQHLACVFRNIDLKDAAAIVQPIDLRIMRHDRREPARIEADATCRFSNSALACDRAFASRTWRAWVVPEDVAAAAGTEALDAALEGGLKERPSAVLHTSGL